MNTTNSHALTFSTTVGLRTRPAMASTRRIAGYPGEGFGTQAVFVVGRPWHLLRRGRLISIGFAAGALALSVGAGFLVGSGTPNTVHAATAVAVVAHR